MQDWDFFVASFYMNLSYFYSVLHFFFRIFAIIIEKKNEYINSNGT